MKRSKTAKSKSSRSLTRIDWATITIYLLLSLLGVVMIFNASVVEAFYHFSDKYHFLKLQLLWLGAGFGSFLVALFIPLKFWRRLSPYLFFVVAFLLILVLLPGASNKVYGARRWLYLGPLSIQPSEIIKFAAVVYLPALVLKNRRFTTFLTVVGTIVLLLMLEPDLGTSLVFTGVAVGTYFASGAPLKSLITLGILALVIGSLLVVISPYRLNRVQTFLDPMHDPQGSSYHIRQILISAWTINQSVVPIATNWT